MIQKIKKWMNNLTVAKLIVVMVLLLGGLSYFGAALLALSLDWAAYSGMPYAIAKALIGCAILKIIDEIMLYEIPTMQNLKKSATGYAIYMFGYAVIIALAISTA